MELLSRLDVSAVGFIDRRTEPLHEYLHKGGLNLRTLCDQLLKIHSTKSQETRVCASANTRLLRLRAVDLEELIAERPQIQAAFVQVLVQRLRSTIDETNGAHVESTQ